jgi:hypothetical protein
MPTAYILSLLFYSQLIRGSHTALQIFEQLIKGVAEVRTFYTTGRLEDLMTKYVMRTLADDDDLGLMTLNKNIQDQKVKSLSVQLCEDQQGCLPAWTSLSGAIQLTSNMFELQGENAVIQQSKINGSNQTPSTMEKLKEYHLADDEGMLTLTCYTESKFPPGYLVAQQFLVVEDEGMGPLRKTPYDSPVSFLETNFSKEVNIHQHILYNHVLSKSIFRRCFSNLNIHKQYLIEPNFFLYSSNCSEEDTFDYDFTWVILRGKVSKLKRYLYACYTHSILHKCLE